ncbi:MAG: LysR family transcriptional regulator [Hyphomonadaceae bacterium]|nr:LysR family transcriptional regulator [Hyphomonadaceae bacterium]
MSRPLPPLNAVRAFEAASRHLSFSRAAEELGVTQGAISKHVISLEDFIGAQVFQRSPTGLSLTQEGYTLMEALRPAFAMMSDAFSHYHRKPPRSSICRIATLASFASQFLVPRLPEFRQAYPDIEIEFITSVRLVDLTREEADLGVRYGLGEYEGLVSSRLVKGMLMPVCAPSVLKSNGGDLASLLATTRRIQTAGYNEWRDWSAIANIDIAATQPAYVIEDFLVAIKALTIGQGIGLLPHLLVQDQLASGELIQFSDTPLEIPHTFHLAHTTTSVRRPFVQTVVEWLRTSLAHLN